MGLKLKRGNNQENSREVTLSARNKDFSGVKKDGRAIGIYGEKSDDLGLGLFDGNSEDHRPKDEEQEKVELKLYSDEDPNDVFHLGKKEEEEGRLRLSGQKDSANKKGTARDLNPWDHPYEEYAMGSRSISKSIDSRTYRGRVEEEHHPVLLIMYIIVATLFFSEIVVLGWVTAQNDVDIQFNLLKFRWLYTAVSSVVLLDAILVNILHRKNGVIVVLALMLPFTYPLKRGKDTNGHSFTGHLICWGWLVAFTSLMMLVAGAISKYGAVVQIPDERIRHEAALVLNQDLDGMSMGNRMKKVIWIEDARYEQQNGEDVVVLMGYDSVYFKNTTFVHSGADDIETRFYFVKNGEGQYELSMVTLDEKEITGQNLQYYWNKYLN